MDPRIARAADHCAIAVVHDVRRARVHTRRKVGASMTFTLIDLLWFFLAALVVGAGWTFGVFLASLVLGAVKGASTRGGAS
jgi:predicted small integral membrane protein